MKIRVKYHDDGIKISQAHQGEWVDLMSAEDVEMKAGEFRLISLGVSIELPDGFEALVVPRSSTYKRYHILQANSVGVIDNAYCGDNDIWKFPAIAMTDTVIHKYDRIAQFCIQPAQGQIYIEAVEHLDNADRGGFGSTGR